MISILRSSESVINGAQLLVSRISVMLLVFATLAVVSLVFPQSATKYLWQIEANNASVDGKLPDNIRSAFDDDDGNPLKSISVDLNGDGIKEKLVPNEFLGGTGGCPWVVFDTKHKRVIGKIDAKVIFVQERKRSGYFLLECFWRNGWDSGSVTTYTFNGKEYVKSGSSSLQDEQIDKYFAERKNIPISK